MRCTKSQERGYERQKAREAHKFDDKHTKAVAAAPGQRNIGAFFSLVAREQVAPIFANPTPETPAAAAATVASSSSSDDDSECGLSDG